VTPVVIDASAAVELVADAVRGRAPRALLPGDAVPWVPETFFVEVGPYYVDGNSTPSSLLMRSTTLFVS
jgi:hypothetical protein